MKNVKKVLSFVFVVFVALILNSKVSSAAEVQYSENVIPKMTGNESPSGKASASSRWGVGYEAWRAFNHDLSGTDGWVSINAAGWLEYEFTEARCIAKYTIVSRFAFSSLGELPQNWTFEGWDKDLNDWVVLDTRTDIIDWEKLVKKEFTFNNTKSYNKYRINITASADGNHVSMGELEMMETVSGSAIKAPKVVLEVKEELQLSVDDDLEENTKVEWVSSDTTVATVDGNGVVTALAPGNTVITVTNEDGTYTESINVLVVESAKDYRLAVDLKVGKSCRLTVDDLTDTVKVIWSSLDPTVATVSSKGKVTAVSKGLTIVTATDEEGNEIGQIYIRVRE